MGMKQWWRAAMAGMVVWGAATAAHAQYLGLYLSPPGEQNTTRAGSIVESFESGSSALGSSGTLAMGTYTTSNQKAQRAPTDQYGGAGGIGKYLAVKGDTITITLTGEQKYLGFWWSAGDNTNNIKFFDRSGNVLASFSTSTLMDFLNRSTAPSWVTAIDGQQYPKLSYYGNPNPPAGRNSNEPYAYMNLILEGTPLLFGKVEITGNNFELDNFAVVRALDISTTWVDLNQIPLAPTAPGIGVNPQKIYTLTNTATIDTQSSKSLSSHSKSTAGDTYSISTAPAHGKVTITDTSTGAYIYTPDAGFAGEDHFVYQLCEGSSGQCVSATVTAVVAPQASDDRYTTAQNTPLQSTVAGNDFIHPHSTYSLVTTVPSSTLALSPDGSFTFTPGSTWTGDFTFTYQVCLPAPHATQCSTANATISVVPPTPPAVAAPPDLSGTPRVDAPITGSYRYTATDGTPEGASLLQWRSSPSNDPAAATSVVDGASYTPTASEEGNYLFLCVTPTNTKGTAGAASCSSGQRIQSLFTSALLPPSSTHAVPVVRNWLLVLMALVVLALSAMRMRRT